MAWTARRTLRGLPVKITRPARSRQSDGSTVRAGTAAAGATVLQAAATVQLSQLTEERRTHVFGAGVRASETVRAPLDWGLEEGDQLEVLAGAQLGERFRIEKVVRYRDRPRLAHDECAIVRLPGGAP